MEARKFSNGQKVMYNGRVFTVNGAHYMYYPDGSWWEYYLSDGYLSVTVAEKFLEPINSTPKEKKVVSEPKNGKKRKNKGYGNKTKEA